MKDMIEKLLTAAKKAGIQPFEARIETSGKLSVATFNTEVENYTVAETATLKVRGLIDGKCGVFTSDRVDEGVVDTAIAALKESAKYGNPVDPDFFVDGKTYKYEKLELFDEKLAALPAQAFIALATSVSEKTLKRDARIESVNVQVEYEYGSLRMANSNGLDVSHRNNLVFVFGSVKAADGDEVESGEYYEFVGDTDKFDADAFAAKLADDAVNAFGGSSVDSGKYKVVYSPDCVAALMSAVKNGFSAFNAENHLSLLEGKLGQKVFSPLLTVEQTPIGDGPFCSPFDDEGVPCGNGLLIDKGVPTDYVYDLATAKRAGKKSTGNGSLVGGNIRPAIGSMTVRCGGKSLEELFEHIGDGLYLTSLAGIGTGLNPQSGAYSLQSSGFAIKNGKIDRPVSLVTVAGNIMTDFADVTAVGSDAKQTYYGINTPSLAIGSLSVSGVKKA